MICIQFKLMNSSPGSLPAKARVSVRLSKGLGLLCLLFASLAHAQNFTLIGGQTGGGGVASSGGAFSAVGAAGQPDSGTQSGGTFSVEGGIVVAAQTPDAPLLTVLRTGNTVVASWPTGAGGFVLQQRAAVAGPVGWVNSPFAVSDNGTNKTVIISPSVGHLFLRLGF